MPDEDKTFRGSLVPRWEFDDATLHTLYFETQNSVTAHAETQILQLQILVPSTVEREGLVKMVEDNLFAA